MALLGGHAQYKLEKSVMAGMRKKEVANKLDKLGFDVAAISSKELAAIQLSDFKRWEQPIKSTGIALD